MAIMRNASLALRALASNLDRETQRLQTQLSTMPGILQRGLARMPDELLALTLEWTVWMSDAGKARNPISLSHVSRRFRRAALALPAIWTDLDIMQGEAKRDLYLSRSRTAGLSFKHHSPHLHSTFTAFIDAHGWRLRSLDIYLCSNQVNFWKHLGMVWSAPAFPALKVLHLEGICGDDGEGAGMEVLSSWSIPVLRDLELDSVIPPPGFASTISTLLIRLEETDWDLASFVAFLDSLKMLKSLHVVCEDVAFISTDPSTRPVAHLSAVETFTLDVDLCSADLRAVMESLYLPAVSNMVVDLKSSEPVDISCLFLATTDFSSVRAFSLKLECQFIVDARTRHTVVDILLRHLRGLAHLCLSMPDAAEDVVFPISSWRNNSWKAIHNVRSIRLENCVRFDGECCVPFLRIPGPECTHSNLSRLEVVGCPLFNWRAFREKCPNVQIVWED